MRIRVHLAADAGITPGYSTAPDTSLLPQWELGRAPRTWRFQVIDTLLNLLFRCAHRRLTRPVAPITKAGQPHSQSYVVCLDCGKQFEYDLTEMRVGKVIDHSNDACVVPRASLPPKTKVKYALLAVVPAAVVLGVVSVSYTHLRAHETGRNLV